MVKFKEFLNQLNRLTEETGVIISNFGDPFYDPKLTSREPVKDSTLEDSIFLSYDHQMGKYIGKKGDPYNGEIVYPED